MISPTRSLNSVKISCFLGAADMLHQGLLGILRGNSAKTDWSDFDFNFFAHLGIGLDPSGIKNRDLVVFGDNLFRND